MATKICAACGLDCSKCGAYIAKQTNDNALREKTANEWNKIFKADFKPEQINCDGCLAIGEHSGYCHACPIRACVIEQKIANCYSCFNHAICQKRMDFEKHSGLKIADLFADSK